MRGSCSMESLKKPDPGFSTASLANRLREVLHVPASTSLCVALSGGLDSTVLLHALAALRHEYPLTLSAVHIDHGLHRDSAHWAASCAQFCRSLDVPLRVQRVEVRRQQGDGLEAAARRARYAAIAGLVPPGASLITAHQADDQAETLLLQLLRGAGVAGLAGMAGQRQMGTITLLRPLLDVSRAALTDYATRHDLRWIEDPSNSNDQLRRNFLRAEILPRLSERWPEARTSLTRAANHAAEAQELLDEMAQQDLTVCTAGDAGHVQALSIPGMLALSAARQRNLLRYWLRHMKFQVPDTRKLDEMQVLLMQTSRSRHACVRCSAFEVWRYRDQLVAVPTQPAPSEMLDLAWNPQSPIEIEGVGRLHAEPVTGEGLACGQIAGGALHIRLRRGGEALQLPGRTHHHRLKKLLQEAAVPPWERARLPLLFLGTQLAAVADRWVSRDFAANAREPGFRIVWTPFPERLNRP